MATVYGEPFESEVNWASAVNINAVNSILDGSGLGSTPGVFLFMFAGESNSRGYALSSELSAPEKAARNIDILNNTTLVFEALNIGADNNAAFQAGRHGPEAEIANLFDAGVFSPFSVKLVKCGQGGSTISQWAINGAHWNTLVARKVAAESGIGSSTYRWSLFWHCMVNDAILGTTAASWKASTVALFANLRTLIPNLIIIFPSIPYLVADAYPTYVTALREICNADPLTRYAETHDAAMLDEYHWNTVGYKLVVRRYVAELIVANAFFRPLSPVADNEIARSALYLADTRTNLGLSPTQNVLFNSLTTTEFVKSKYGLVHIDTATLVEQWWTYINGDGNLYVRDMVNARMQVSYTPGASSQLATTAFGSNITVGGAGTFGGGLIATGLTVTTAATGDIASFGANTVPGLFKIKYDATIAAAIELVGSVYGPIAILSQANNNVLLIPGTGNVGVGVFLPTEKLHVSGNIQATGNISVAAGTLSDTLSFSTVGKGLIYKSGTGALAGNAVLVAGTVTVTNVNITANSVIMFGTKTAGGTPGNITYTLSAGASFTINSDNVADTRTLSYEIVQVT